MSRTGSPKRRSCAVAISLFAIGVLAAAFDCRPGAGALAAAPSASVRGRVTDEQGMPLEGATVRPTGMEELREDGWVRVPNPGTWAPSVTDKEGWFTLPVSGPNVRYDLCLDKPGFGQMALRGVRAGQSPAPNPASQAASPAGPAGAPPKPQSGLVTNIWVDTDLRQALQDIAAQTGTTVLADPTAQGVISMSVKDMPLEECLERICAPGGLSFVRVKDYYLVGRAEPGTEMFRRLAGLQRVKLRHATSDEVKGMLPQTLDRYVSYDKANGAVLVNAPPGMQERVLNTIQIIDRPNRQVAVEAIVFELSEEGSKQLGLDWQYKNASLAAKTQSLIGTVTYDASSDIAAYVDITLRAILQDLKGQVLANPRIVVQNGKKAEIFVGQEKYYSLLSGYAANPYFHLESIKAGVTLEVTPYIGDQGQVTLDIKSEVSDVITDWSREPDNGNNPSSGSLPLVTRRQAKTTVGMKDGSTVIIGGLLQDQHRKVVEKVPLLGDIPLLGMAFRDVRARKEQKEIVVLITAHLITDDAKSALPDMATQIQQQYVSPLDAIRTHALGERK